jgi:hypothetical protein
MIRAIIVLPLVVIAFACNGCDFTVKGTQGIAPRMHPITEKQLPSK